MTASPLEATTNSTAAALEPQQEPLWEFGALTLDTSSSSTRRRSTHRRSQSTATLATSREYRSDYHSSASRGLERPIELRRDSMTTSTSALSLPTLAEDNDDNPPERPKLQRGRTWVVEPPTTYTHSRRGSNATIAGQFVSQTTSGSLRHRATISFGTPASPGLSRRGSFASLHGEPTPLPVPASVSVSDVAALATMSQEPTTPSRRNSTANPSDTLRARLRTLSQLEGKAPEPAIGLNADVLEPPPSSRSAVADAYKSPADAVTQPPALHAGCDTPISGPADNVVPPSACAAPNGRSEGDPLGAEPHAGAAVLGSRDSRTSNRYSLEMPPPPLPLSRRPSAAPSVSGEEPPEILLPYRSAPRDAPGDLFTVRPPRPPRRGSTLSMVETPTPTSSEQSSPGSLVSDSGSLSPTSIESLSIGPAMMRERERERAREEAQLKLTAISAYSTRRNSRGPAWKARRARVTQSMHLDLDEERFLDFDDI
ncbi:hypothetical protein A1Q1_07624 [Trichosporon asahii var. asahii CBS 2479]|uniref:Uncharacterized protein n=1 Tax=Trichosporon asahii var. asahii (strain ATCC 90039 / CBS 2479 / JCM 2466 / KCTC 7840 / NBRC 103889/ NCYC 2677 / UAMH 7654) TaxID=1186058 RepID=J4UHR6_TRIAS|nr:hypothetical protein A1Q1_07624 [Trichosporon asahii var. asahii CBS 2479]EJT51160.1 hypothetical protein A1Q1_07624 [Trichosporon asahii var. asahii CBS 2479]